MADLSKSNAKELNRARAIRNMPHNGLAVGGAEIYARMVAGLHRAASAGQQRAIEASIEQDGTAHLFTRHPANGCLLAAPHGSPFARAA